MSKGREKHGWFFHLLTVVSVLVVLGVLVAGAGAGYAWWQWSSTPSYWQANQRFKATHTHAQRQRMADRAWNRWMSDLTGRIHHDPVDASPGVTPTRRHKPPHAPVRQIATERTEARGSNGGQRTGSHKPTPITSPARMLPRRLGTRTLHLHPADVNAWLQTRLQDWLANQGLHLPRQVSDPMITIENGKPVVAFELHARHIDNVISVVLDPHLTAGGRLSVRVDSIRGGRLPMPADQLIAKARKLAPGHDADINRALSILEGGKTFEPVVKLDSRQVRLVALAIHKNSIDLTIRHEKVGAGMKHPPPSLPGISP